MRCGVWGLMSTIYTHGHSCAPLIIPITNTRSPWPRRYPDHTLCEQGAMAGWRLRRRSNFFPVFNQHLMLSQQTRDVEPMLGWCRPSVVDDEPTSTQHWFSVSVFAGMQISILCGQFIDLRCLNRLDMWSSWWSNTILLIWGLSFIFQARIDNKINLWFSSRSLFW